MMQLPQRIDIGPYSIKVERYYTGLELTYWVDLYEGRNVIKFGGAYTREEAAGLVEKFKCIAARNLAMEAINA